MSLRKCCAAALLLAGCSHQFEVLNRSDFAVEKIHDEKHAKLNVALLCEPYQIANPNDRREVFVYKTAKTPIPVEKSFLLALARSLCDQGGYNAFVTDDPNMAKRADVKIRISEQVDGSSCGKNFLIGFPGCVVNAPAWNGYAYEVKWQFQVSIENMSTGLPIGDLLLDRNMDVRYASMGDEDMPIGNYFLGTMWFLPPVGTIVALVEAGCNAGPYHEGTTFAARRSGALAFFADGIAQEIIAKINVAYVPKEKSPGAQSAASMSSRPVLGVMSSDRAKELDSLLKADVITEEEYKKELEKLK